MHFVKLNRFIIISGIFIFLLGVNFMAQANPKPQTQGDHF